MFKYPRTRHVRGSRFQHGDHDMEAAPWEELEGHHLIVEEKIDGANCGISFSPEGELLLQSRGHYLRGGPREKHFNLLKQWAACHQDVFFKALTARYVMYGEWMFAKHTYFYDALPHYFMEFDVLDTDAGTFLDTPSRQALLRGLPISSVRILHDGPCASLGHLADMIGNSGFITNNVGASTRRENLWLAAIDVGVDPKVAEAHTDMHSEMEGLYIKHEQDGIVKGRFKFVRDSFTNAILDQDEHWHSRPIIQNVLVPGAFEKMFQP